MCCNFCSFADGILQYMSSSLRRNSRARLSFLRNGHLQALASKTSENLASSVLCCFNPNHLLMVEMICVFQIRLPWAFHLCHQSYYPGYRRKKMLAMQCKHNQQSAYRTTKSCFGCYTVEQKASANANHGGNIYSETNTRFTKLTFQNLLHS